MDCNDRVITVGLLHRNGGEIGETVFSFNNFDSSTKKSSAGAPAGAGAPDRAGAPDGASTPQV